MSLFPGLITALATPFNGGKVDFASLEKLVDFQLHHQIQGFVVSGTTGESPTLTRQEKREIFQLVQKLAQKKVPVLMGTGTNSTATTIEATREAQEWKADGALIVSPYYNKPPQRGLVAHYKAVAENTDIPIVMYNVPGRTSSEMSVETIVELSQIPNIVGIKEASGKLNVVASLAQNVRKDFSLISGDDGTCLEFMRAGGVGVISVLSHVIPQPLGEMIQAAKSGGPRELGAYSRLNELLFSEANPIPVKSALCLMGIFASDEMRLPLVPVAAQLRSELERELRKLELLP